MLDMHSGGFWQCLFEKISSHAGNASTIGSLLLDTAYLTTGASQANATAHNISAIMLAAKLSPEALNETFAQASLQVSETNTLHVDA